MLKSIKGSIKALSLVFCLGILYMPVFSEIIIYPGPTGEINSKDFYVTVNGRNLFTYQARVSAMPVNQVWPGYQRPVEQTELASFATFDTDEDVMIHIKSTEEVKNIVIRPQSYNIKPIVKGNIISFKINKACQLVVEVNGWHKALHLFVNPIEINKPKPTDKGVLYFGPGIHKPGIITAKDNQTIYVAGGAVVHGVIIAKKIKNLKISGRGIIDASSFSRSDAKNIISIDRCENTSVDGVILRDPNVWTLLVNQSRYITINNIKLIGLWRYNADGIDIINSRNVIVENSFVRSFDDNLVLKGWSNNKDKNDDYITATSDIKFNNCVLWNDWGRALEIGAETALDSIYNITYTNIDIIHYVHIAMDIQNGDRAYVSNILYQDIRVEEPLVDDCYLDDPKNPLKNKRNMEKYSPAHKCTGDEVGRLFDLNIRQNPYSQDTIRGYIEKVTFKNIKYNSDRKPISFFEGFSDEHAIKNIFFENVYINGTKIKDELKGNFIIKNFVRNLTFK